MPMYLIPPVSPNSETERMCTAAGVQFTQVEKLYELIQAYPQDGKIVVATISVENMIILARNMSTLLPGTLEGVIAAPDVVYPTKWTMIATTFGVTDWLEFEKKIIKTGMLASTTEEVEQRVVLQSKNLPDDVLNAPNKVAAAAPPRRRVGVPRPEVDAQEIVIDDEV